MELSQVIRKNVDDLAKQYGKVSQEQGEKTARKPKNYDKNITNKQMS